VFLHKKTDLLLWNLPLEEITKHQISDKEILLLQTPNSIAVVPF
jgi:hypothetical protein